MNIGPPSWLATMFIFLASSDGGLNIYEKTTIMTGASIIIGALWRNQLLRERADRAAQKKVDAERLELQTKLLAVTEHHSQNMQALTVAHMQTQARATRALEDNTRVMREMKGTLAGIGCITKQPPGQNGG